MNKYLYLIAGYFFVRPVSYFFPKSKSIWIFGSDKHAYEGNSKYLMSWILRNKKEIFCVWIAADDRSARNLREQGLVAFSKWSLKAFYYRCRAGVYVFNSYLTDCGFFFSQRALDINLWHGVGLKKIEHQLKRRDYKESLINRLKNPHKFKKPSIFLVTSDFMCEHFSSAFRLAPESIYKGAYPRLVEDLSLDFKDKFANFDKVFLYAPTFRDDKSQGNILFNAGDDFFGKLNNKLKQSNSFLIIKSHKNEKFNLNFEYSNLSILDHAEDLIPYARFVDVLITDYSSVFYDFLFIGRCRFIIFSFDYESYIKKSRNLIDDFYSNVSRNVAKDLESLQDLMFQFEDKDDEEYLNDLKNKFWSYSFNSSCEDLFGYIDKKIKLNYH